MGSAWQSWRRSLDYYPEGELIWLEVDSSFAADARHNSLDDFCRRFHGGESGPRKLCRTPSMTLSHFGRSDSLRLVHAAPDELGATSTHAPLGGIEHDGWKLV